MLGGTRPTAPIFRTKNDYTMTITAACNLFSKVLPECNPQPGRNPFPNTIAIPRSGSAALEPVGEVPDLTSLSPFVINEELRNLEVSTGSLFNFSFFITQNMK